MKKATVTLANLNPSGNKKKKFSVYLNDRELEWLKKLTEENNFPSRSQFLSALLNREIESYKENKK